MIENNTTSQTNFTFQKWIALIGIALFIGKLLAWHLTNSDTVFSDAMESIVNIIAAFMGLYSLYLSSKPKDEDHPYGHGKVEFVTSGIEGSLIIFAGIMIIVQAIDSLMHGKNINKIDYGIYIVALTGIINYVLGYLSIKKGERENSLVLISSGKHLQSDTITTLGVVISLIIVYFTQLFWIDAVIALVFALYIMVVGYKIIRKSLSGIMDEADPELLENFAKILNNNRKIDWIDLHNTRIQQHGNKLHIDSHLTLPYYYELRKAHQCMEEVIKVWVENTDRNIEFNLHMDDCKPFSCEICQILDCPVRQKPFVKIIPWDANNISQVQKHQLNTSNDNRGLEK
ncbi:MAG: cation transporter [Bacteroidetes bacterium]|nr:cation transporter [Bacteroidota bacterium]